MTEPNAGAWSGRFSDTLDARVKAFNASLHFDHRLAAFDLQGCIAHVRMLTDQGILARTDGVPLQEYLRILAEALADGQADWDPAAEDIHSGIERKLTDVLGEPGKRLHTGRSRNDQVATALRLYTRDALDGLVVLVRGLQAALLDQAERGAALVMPGFTHLQAAQPVTFGHHLLAYFEMLDRDADRLVEARRRMNTCPLGAAALAGTSYPIDREATAASLQFAAPARNSLDAVSDRDFVLDFLYAASALMVHLSRLAEELILWSSSQFAFVALPDAFCTGSSIMPQKKNPDVPELVRGKTGRVCGHLLAILMTMKAQPLAYNKDNQECQEALFDAHDTVRAVLEVMTPLVAGLRPQAAAMRAAAERGFSTATDLADALVRAGVAFRDAHEIVARAVREAADDDLQLHQLGVDRLRRLVDLVVGTDRRPDLPWSEDWLHEVLSVDGSVAQRAHLGGTAPACVQREVRLGRQRLAGFAGAGT